MKKWYEWMRKHHDPEDASAEFLYKNLNKETACLREWIDRNDYHVFHEAPCFQGKQYAESLDDYYLNQNLSREQVAEWIDDPEYARLIKDSGMQVMAVPPKDTEKQFRDSIRDIFPIDWDTAHIVIQVQRPGDMFPLHYDRFKNQVFTADQGIVQRWVIMIYDQQPGQCFFMNDCNVPWKAGDVISWNQTNYSHGSANFGYQPRFSVRLTGRLLKS